MPRSMMMVVAFALLAVACGDDDGTEPTSSPAPVTASPVDATEAPATSASPGQPAEQLTATTATGWTAIAVARGIKPDLALDSGGRPAIAFLFEDLSEGFVGYASAADEWSADLLVEGYFYGPIGLAFGADGEPHIAYHDHQANDFMPDLGDLTRAVRRGAVWEIDVAEDDGHDGWDSTIAVASDGVVHAAGVDPAQFDRLDGVEHYQLVDGEWVVTAIGSGPTEYEWNVSLDLGPDGSPALTYFDSENLDLIFAERVEGEWVLTNVFDEGDVGRFSSLVLDAAGEPHISFARVNSDGTTDIMYAERTEGGWTVEDLATLDEVQIGFTGARRITDIALDPAGTPVIAYSDVAGIHVATRTGDGWFSTEVVAAGSRPLGQLVSLAIDDAGISHLAFYEVAGSAPLDGVVGYVTG